MIPHLSTVIAKPTKVCNADCSYCSAPPDGAGKWDFSDFKRYFDRLSPYLTDEAYWIWHGGEPMLMGPGFIRKCAEYAWKTNPRLHFSMQTNLLGYDSKRWKSVFMDVLGGSLSTSYDPYEKYRLLKGDAARYKRVFLDRLEAVLDDGFRPMVISVWDEQSAHGAQELYELSRSKGDRAFPLRFNYCYPAGRASDMGESIAPATYGKMLLDLYNRWIKDLPEFTITPLDQMFKKTLGEDGLGHCPWTRSCGGHFIGLEPNGDAYNCSEFADFGDPTYCFGNLDRHSFPELMASPPAAAVRRRAVAAPIDCQSCEHYRECEGGCMRDAILFKHGLYGKFHYCQSWKMVFTRIKESILSGEADGAIAKYGFDPQAMRRRVWKNLSFQYSMDELALSMIQEKGAGHPLGFFERAPDGARARNARLAAERASQGIYFESGPGRGEGGNLDSVPAVPLVFSPRKASAPGSTLPAEA